MTTETLAVGGSNVTVGGETIDFTTVPAVTIAAQSAFVPIISIPTARVAAQSAFVPVIPNSRVHVAAQSAFVPVLQTPFIRRRTSYLVSG
jgi:hypothetical protein